MVVICLLTSKSRGMFVYAYTSIDVRRISTNDLWIGLNNNEHNSEASKKNQGWLWLDYFRKIFQHWTAGTSLYLHSCHTQVTGRFNAIVILPNHEYTVDEHCKAVCHEFKSAKLMKYLVFFEPCHEFYKWQKDFFFYLNKKSIMTSNLFTETKESVEKCDVEKNSKIAKYKGIIASRIEIHWTHIYK